MSNGKPRCIELIGGVECELVKSANAHVLGHPDFDHPYRDPRPVGISPVGRRMQRFNASDEGKEYRARGREISKGETPCQIVSPVCTGTAQAQHEDKTRGKSGGIDAAIRKGTQFFPSCHACNTYVSDNQVWARENGFIVRARDIDREQAEIDL